MSTDPRLVAPGASTAPWPSSAAPAAGPPPERVVPGALLAGRYRVGLRIGAGGMASIHQAHDLVLGRDVAVKVLHPHLADDPALLERFREEARHAAGLLHPNVVAVFDTGVADLPYIVMELVDGPSLREVLLARGRVGPAEAARLVGSVCAALARAHDAGIVHRDVKPENVLVAAALDGTQTVKVADFGIARAVAEAGHTQTGALVGSVHYLAPELVDGLPATPASDQYAVGVLLYELLTGRRPLPADTPSAVALRHAREQIPPPSDVQRDVPHDLDRVVARATALSPARRFADVRELGAALAAAVAGVTEPGDGGAARTVRQPAPEPREGTLVIPPDSLLTATTVARGDLRDRVFGPRRVDSVVALIRSSRCGPVRRRVDRGLALAAVAAAIALALGGWALFDRVLAPTSAVPSLAGLDRESAAALLQPLGLGLAVVDARGSADVPAGEVLAQEPDVDGALRRGRSVEVVLSAGPVAVVVPEVAGRPAEQALAVLRAAPYQLEVARRDVSDPEVAAGLVVRTDPAGGASVRQGTEVVLEVSVGSAPVEVPDVVGLPRAQALARLEEAGLEISVSEAYRDDEPRLGRVASQSPRAGAAAQRGREVALVVSRGPATVRVPDVRGQTVETAVDRLETAGFEVEVVEERRPRLGPISMGRVGYVEEQDPGPLGRLARGGRITLVTYTDR